MKSRVKLIGTLTLTRNDHWEDVVQSSLTAARRWREAKQRYEVSEAKHKIFSATAGLRRPTEVQSSIPLERPNFE